jgi:hypothetical protein
MSVVCRTHPDVVWSGRAIFASRSYKLQVATQAADIEVLILGNSHAAYGLDPRGFSLDAFNAASVNQSLYFDKRITMKYIDELSKLKYVLISIDFHSLYYSNEGARTVWSYYGYGINYKDSLPAATRYSRLYGYSAKLAFEFLRRSLDPKYKQIRSVDADYDLDLDHPYTQGYVGKMGGPYLAENDNRQRADFFNDIVRSSKERGSILLDLEGLIDTLKQRNITPILITLPCFGPFEELLDKKVLEQNSNDIRDICDRWKVPYWDYFRMALDSNCFYNADHLNEKGASVVTREVNRKIAALNIAPPI